MRSFLKLAGVCMLAAAGVAALAQEPATGNARHERGRQVFNYWCASCHGAGEGVPGLGGLPGTMALRLKYEGKVPAVLEERTDLTPEFVSHFVRHGVSVMPFFRKTEISDADLAALGAYLSKPQAGNGRKTTP